MAEVAIDISGEYPEPWTDEIVPPADMVITMGCGACRYSPGRRYEESGSRRSRRTRPRRRSTDPRRHRGTGPAAADRPTRARPCVTTPASRRRKLALPAASHERPTTCARIGRMFGSIIDWLALAIPTMHPAPDIRRCCPQRSDGVVGATNRRDRGRLGEGHPTLSTSRSPSPRSPTSCPPEADPAQFALHLNKPPKRYAAPLPSLDNWSLQWQSVISLRSAVATQASSAALRARELDPTAQFAVGFADVYPDCATQVSAGLGSSNTTSTANGVL